MRTGLPVRPDMKPPFEDLVVILVGNRAWPHRRMDGFSGETDARGECGHLTYPAGGNKPVPLSQAVVSGVSRRTGWTTAVVAYVVLMVAAGAADFLITLLRTDSIG